MELVRLQVIILVAHIFSLLDNKDMKNIFFSYPIIGDNMKKRIGMIAREDSKYYLCNKEICAVIESYDMIPICIISGSNMMEILRSCDGVILQGGDHYDDYDLKVVKYVYENNIPTFGICLGMQTMAAFFNGDLKYIGNNNHQSDIDYVHVVTIKKDSKLYEILKKDSILVNSRHIEHIQNTTLDVVGNSDDGIIEAVEDKTKKFFIGVQWHPESIMHDIHSQKLFDAFFSSI